MKRFIVALLLAALPAMATVDGVPTVQGVANGTPLPVADRASNNTITPLAMTAACTDANINACTGASAVSIDATGQMGASFVVPTGNNIVGTLKADCSPDGISWIPTNMDTNVGRVSQVTLASGVQVAGSIVPCTGMSFYRVRLAVLTSGTTTGTISMFGTLHVNQSQDFVGSLGTAPPEFDYTNLHAVGGTTIGAKTLPANGAGQTAIPVWANAYQLATYKVFLRGAVSGALTAATPKALLTVDHPVGATKTVKVRRVLVGCQQTTALAGIMRITLTRGTAQASAGTVITPAPTNPGTAAAEATVRGGATAPTITAATVIGGAFLSASATAASFVSPFTVVYDWQEGGETQPYQVRAATLESFVVNAESSVAMNLTCDVTLTFTEE